MNGEKGVAQCVGSLCAHVTDAQSVNLGSSGSGEKGIMVTVLV